MSCPHCAHHAWQTMGDAEMVAAAARLAGLEGLPGFDPMADDAHCMLLLARVVCLGVDRIVADAWAYSPSPEAALRYVRRNVVRAAAKRAVVDGAKGVMDE